MKKWKIFITIVCMLFLVGSVINFTRALDFDNVKNYDKKTKTLTITNSLGLGDVVAEIKLDTPLVNYVMRGEDRLVAEFTIVSEENYDNVFKQMDFYNVKKGMKKFDRDFTYKYKEIYEKNKIRWITLDEKTQLPKGKITIGIFTDVYPNERIEWVPTLFGVEINEWAVWVESLDVGLLHYYSFEENTGTNVEDVVGGSGFDGTTLNGAWTSGIIGYGYNSTNHGVMNITNNLTDMLPNNFSINFWVFDSETAVDRGYFQTVVKGGDGLENRIIAQASTRYGWITNRSDNFFTAIGTHQQDKWVMITATINDTGKSFYVNGTRYGFNKANATNGFNNVVFGYIFDVPENNFTGTMDEIGFWNRTLTPTEITNLYNDGTGIEYRVGDVILNSPIENYNSISNIVTFNCSTEDAVQMDNITLIIDGVKNLTVTGSSTYIDFEQDLIMPFGTHTWNCNATNSGNVETTGFERSMTLGFSENSQTYNATTYETSSESFILNLSHNSSYFTSTTASLIYNGTSYSGTASGTGSEKIFIRTIDIPTVTGQQNKSFYWNVSLTGAGGTEYFTTDSNIQTINPINLTLCEGAPQDTVYLNFTFKDEATGTLMSARNDLTDFDYWLGGGSVTKSFTMSNTSVNPSYAFCMNPPDRPVEVDLSFKYSNSTHPIRTFAYDDQTLTNSTTNQILYLLGSGDGIYSSIQVVTASSSPISGVKITIERQFSGVWGLIEQGTTGTDGLATFWVNPNFEHRITATKTGYSSTQVTINPSQSVYTITLEASSDDATYEGSLKGMNWFVTPATGRLDPGSTTFNFNLTASLGNLDGGFCKFELIDVDDESILATTSGGYSTGCNLSITYTVVDNSKISGKLYIDTTNTTGFVVIDDDAYWVGLETTVDTKAFFYFLQDFKDLPEFGDGIRQEYSRVVFFFFFLIILVGMATYFTGYDFANPGAAVLLVYPMIILASFAGWFDFNHLSSYDFLNKYTVALIASFIVGGYTLNYFGKA